MSYSGSSPELPPRSTIFEPHERTTWISKPHDAGPVFNVSSQCPERAKKVLNGGFGRSNETHWCIRVKLVCLTTMTRVENGLLVNWANLGEVSYPWAKRHSIYPDTKGLSGVGPRLAIGSVFHPNTPTRGLTMACPTVRSCPIPASRWQRSPSKLENELLIK